MKKTFTGIVSILAVLFVALPGFAKVTHHDYYVPWVPGADNCYGAYRVVIGEGEVRTTTFDGTVVKAFSSSVPEKRSPRIAVFEDRSTTREDIIVLTDFALQAERIDYIPTNGPDEDTHIHRFYYETPYLFVGTTTTLNPFTGISDGEGGTTVRETAITRDLALKYFTKKISSEEFARLTLPAFGGAEPKGGIVATKPFENGFKHIFSLSVDSPETVGWWRQLSQEAMLEVAAGRKDGYDVSFDFGTDAFEGGLRTEKSEAGKISGLYLHPGPFPGREVVSAAWEDASTKLFEAVEKRIPIPKTRKVTIESSAAGWGGWHSALEKRPPVKTTVEYRTEPIPKAVVEIPSGTRSALYKLSPHAPGGWSLTDGNNGVIAVRSGAPDAIALWPFADAQKRLAEAGKTASLLLDGNNFTKPAEIFENAIPKNGAIDLCDPSWIRPDDFTGSLHGANPNVPLWTNENGVHLKDSRFEALFANEYAKSGSGAAGAWTSWSKRNPAFYKTLSTALSSRTGFLFDERFGSGSLMIEKGRERRFKPLLSFSGTFQDSMEKVRTNEELLNTLKSDIWASAGPEALKARNESLTSELLKTRPPFAFSIKGERHMSRILETVVRQIPMGYDETVSVLMSIPKIAQAFDTGILSLPDRKIHEQKDRYFPVSGSFSSPAGW